MSNLIGGSSSKTYSTTYASEASNNTLEKDSTLISVGQIGAGAAVQVVDHGAVAGALDLGNNAIAANVEALGIATDLAHDVVGRGFDQSDQALENADRQVTQAIGTVGAQSSTVANFMRDATNKVGELAKSFQSQGQSDQQKIYLYGALAGITGIVIVAVVLTRGRK